MTVCESGTASPSKLEEIIIVAYAVHNAEIFDLKNENQKLSKELRSRKSPVLRKWNRILRWWMYSKDAPAEERTDEVVCAEEEYLTSLGVLDEDVDIKIFWGGGKTDGII
ncbi:uncharacterized protein OCT59_007569 [Rhizophagus irregularis]|uniref:uncharacterized protein n=1 Tax=Rhizophagus irregularis TaxID=588596 RepID=UPI001C13A5BF|nr:hypothetical protein OCT59_007569 [Rhizophagus irregularis]CAB5185174.1 unnamed protein product [Rhizophagus irregularis]